MLAWFTRLVSSIPEPASDGTVSLRIVVEASLAFIQETAGAGKRSALDRNAARKRARRCMIMYVSLLT